MVVFFVFFLIFAQKVGGGGVGRHGPTRSPLLMLIFGDTLINMKNENRRKKFVHNLKALKKFLQSPKAKKKSYQHKIAHPPPPPQKMVHPLLQLNEAKWLRQNDVSRKL